jgi:hypothetical protein
MKIRYEEISRELNNGSPKKHVANWNCLGKYPGDL